MMTKYRRLIFLTFLLGVDNCMAEKKVTDTTLLTGDLRAVYFSETIKSDNENSLGLGLNPTVRQESFVIERLTWEVGAGAAVPLSESSKGYAADAGMAQAGDTPFGDPEAESSEAYATLTQFNATYDYGAGGLKAGYQLMDTPMPEKDDIRLVPNSYLAAVVDYTGIPDLTFVAGYVAQMAGAVDSSASENSHAYHSMSDAAVGGMLAEAGLGGNDDVDDRGVAVGAVMYENESRGVVGQFWRYQMEEPYQGMGDFLAMYADAGVTFGGVSVTVQHMRYKNDVWMNTASGAMVETVLGDVALNAAVNGYTAVVDKRDMADTLGLGSAPVPTWYAWGRYPEFVAGEEVDASMADWDGGSAYMLSGTYEGIDKLALTLSYFSYSDAVDAADVVVEYTASEAVSFLLIHETKDFENEEDTSTLELKAFYTF